MQKLAVPLALVVGALLGFLGRPVISGGSAPDSSEIAKLRSDNETLRAQLESAPSPTPPSKLPTAIVPGDGAEVTTLTEGPVTITSSGDLPQSINLDFAALSEQMEKQQSAQDERRTALELAQLKARLGLTPEQEEQIRELLEARAANRRGGLSKIMNLAGGGGEVEPGDLAGLLEGEAGTFQDDLTALLDPEQKAAYEEYRAEQRVNAIEAAASRDLAQLQSMFPLSEDQKDQAFEAFTELAAETEPANGDGLPGLGNPLASRDDRLAALEPILTPEQMEIYQNSPQFGSTMIFGADGDALGSGGVISTIQIDATAGAPAILGGLVREEETE